MDPITRGEIYMATAAGEYDGELPVAETRAEKYWEKIISRIENEKLPPEEIDAAIADYLNTHDVDIVTEAELAEALAGYYNKNDIDTALSKKAPASHTHDDRYYTETEMDTALSGKSDTGHSHAVTDVIGLESALLGKATASHAHDDRYYTESEVDTKLGEKSNTGHLHDDRYYTESEMDTLLSGKADNSDIPDVSAFITRLVNDLVNYYTKSETYTKAEIDSKVSAIPKFAIEVVSSLPVQDISPTTVYLLTSQTQENGNLYTEYLHVGNTWELLGSQTVDLSGYYTSAQVDTLLSGLSVSGHTHDDRYYTETEIDGKVQEINTALAGKAPASHSHDDRYYTETEIDNKLGEKSNTDHSHDDRYYTETEIDNKLGAKQDALTAGNGISISNGEISNSAPNVQSDWNQTDTTADDFIKNKPDLSVYALATFDDVGTGNMTYNNMVSNGTTYPNTVTLKKNANNYRLLLVRYYITRLGGVQLWDYKVIPAPNVAGQSVLLKTFGLSGGTLIEYIFGLQFSADGTTITLTYGENDISLSIRIWGIK